jgi:hypothetical protein
MPNSTADKTRKKNVKLSTFRLSYNKPMVKETIYSVIHNISAVNNKCSALVTLFAMLKNIKKNKIKYKFVSPINIIYKN